MWRLCIAAIALVPLHAQDPVEIVRKSLERDASNFERRKNYTFVSREEQREFDRKGKVKKTETVTYDNIVLAGRPYERMIEKDGKPLSESDQKREQQKLDRELQKREKETPADRARVEKERQEDRRFLREVPNAYNLKIVGTELVSGKPAWVITADPKPNFKPTIPRTDLLKKIRAKIWIDQADLQWVRVDAEAIDTLSFGLALFRVGVGGKLHFEQTRVNDEVWLPSVFSASGDARIGYVYKVRGDINIAYKDYKKFQTDSHMIVAEEK
jgi:hypothetical protein